MTTLTVTPELVQEVQELRVLSTPFPAPMFQRRSIWTASNRKRRRWVGTSELAPVAEKNEIETVYDSTNGAGSFLWTPPGESQIDARFVSAPQIEQRSASIFAFRLEIEEVLP